MPNAGLLENDDPEYDDLVKCEKKGLRILKKNHYRLIEMPPCCDNCKHSDCTDPYDNTYCCDLVDHSRWLVGRVNQFGLCDKYERMK